MKEGKCFDWFDRSLSKACKDYELASAGTSEKEIPTEENRKREEEDRKTDMQGEGA